MTENTNEMSGEEIVNADADISEAKTEEVESIVANKSNEIDFKAKYYYIAAEFDNARKRFEREKENLLKFGNEKVLSALVGVIDNFDLTVSTLKNDNDDKVQNIVKGIEMIRTQFLDVLKNNGLTQVEALGKTFDPNYHEAVAQAPAPDKEDQEVITEYQRGYLLNGRLLRAARVVVANNK